MPTRLLIAGLLVMVVSACQGTTPTAVGTAPASKPQSTTGPSTAGPTTSPTRRPTQAPSPTPVVGLFRPDALLSLKDDHFAEVTGKFDGNATLDIAVLSKGKISLLLAKNGGAFAETSIETGGDGPGALAAADINGDHRLDIVVVHSGTTDQGVGSDDLAVLLGHGDGTFTTSIVPTGVNAQALVIADLDRDGDQDIATANDGDHVSVFRGHGDGTFRAPVSYPIGAPFASGITAADLDGDGVLDLVTANSLIGRGRSARTVSVLIGKKSGTFAAPVLHEAGYQPIRPVVADLNGDGHPDVATPNGFPSHGVSVLLSAAGRGLLPGIEYETGPNPHTAIAADLDGDGHLDIAAWNSGEMGGPVGKGLSILFGIGDGTFRSHVDQVTAETGNDLVAAGDLDGDGRVDLIVDGETGLILLYNSMAP